jgi:hypothetical protein
MRELPFELQAFITFLLFDRDGDGAVSRADLFRVMQSQDWHMEQDLLALLAPPRTPSCDIPEILAIMADDPSLNYRDYRIYFKKVDKPLLITEAKKNTAFHRSVAVIEHRQEIRILRKELEQEKTRIQSKRHSDVRKGGEGLGVK